MQYSKITLDSNIFIERINTFPKTYITNCVDPEKTEKTFLNLPLELVNILIPVLITIFLFFLGALFGVVLFFLGFFF